MWKVRVVAIPTRTPSISLAAREYGFMTYPEFSDNGAVQGNNPRRIATYLKANWRDVYVAVLPDYAHDLWPKLVRRFWDVIWIAPIHRREEFEIAASLDGLVVLGVPHVANAVAKFVRREELGRDYKLHEAISAAKELGMKIWWLGLKETNWQVILDDITWGFDTVIPIIYATRFGKLWLAPNRAEKPRRFMTNNAIARENIKNFKEWLWRHKIVPAAFRKREEV